jgi:hypothetical protein
MNKLTTVLGSAVALTVWLVPLNAARAASSDTQEVTVWDTTGYWTGTADVGSSVGIYQSVPVTLRINNQQILTTSGPMGDQNYLFVQGTLSIGPPFGTGDPMPLAGSLDLKQGNTTMQKGKFTLAGDLFTGELHAMSMTMEDMNTLTATGSIIFVGDGKRKLPAVAKLGLTKM